MYAIKNVKEKTLSSIVVSGKPRKPEGLSDPIYSIIEIELSWKKC
jgi:hypothetical protein